MMWGGVFEVPPLFQGAGKKLCSRGGGGRQKKCNQVNSVI